MALRCVFSTVKGMSQGLALSQEHQAACCATPEYCTVLARSRWRTPFLLCCWSLKKGGEATGTLFCTVGWWGWALTGRTHRYQFVLLPAVSGKKKVFVAIGWLFSFTLLLNRKKKRRRRKGHPPGFDGIVSKPRRARQKRGHQEEAAKCSNDVNNLVSYLFGSLQKCRQQNVLVLVCLPFLAGRATERRLFLSLSVAFFLLFFGRQSHALARTKSPTGMSGPFFAEKEVY